MQCRSMGVLERVPLSVVLRRTGSNLSSQARVSGDRTPSPTTDSEDANLFTPRWPTLSRSLACLEQLLSIHALNVVTIPWMPTY